MNVRGKRSKANKVTVVSGLCNNEQGLCRYDLYGCQVSSAVVVIEHNVHLNKTAASWLQGAERHGLRITAILIGVLVDVATLATWTVL